MNEEIRGRVSMEGVDALRLLGRNDGVLREIERLLPVRITMRDGELRLRGAEEDVNRARALLEKLIERVKRGQAIGTRDGVGDSGTRRRRAGA